MEVTIVTEQKKDMIANPDRVTIDEEEELRETEPAESKENPPPAPHNQPWPDVAKEVREAVEEADGPV